MVVQSSSSHLTLQAQFCDYLRQAFAKLNAPVNRERCEAIATTIQQSMVGPWRFFHTLEHCMMVGGMATDGEEEVEGDAIEMLAGAFHDVVYVQADAGIPFCLASCLSPVVQQLGEAIVLRGPQLDEAQTSSADASLAKASLMEPSLAEPNLQWLLSMFDLSPGETLDPQKGQNEFLSALVAVKLLEHYVETETLVAIALCIEATIPFRNYPQPESSSEELLQRLQEICQTHSLEITPAEQVAMVHRAVRIANRDVMSFAESSAAHFLADTWNLLPENHRFSPGGLHRIRDYRRVIEKTEGFFLNLDPCHIFRQFRNEPGPAIYQQWQRQAEENLAVGRLYLSCKLVAIALLEALASPFGTQTPLSLFMGTLPEATASPPLRLEQFFPPPRWPGPAMSELEEQVWQLLSKGRAASSYQGDVLCSPLATFVLQFHGFEPLAEQRQAAYEWLAGSLPCNQFLQHFETQFLGLLFESIRRLWEQRQMVLDAYFRPQAETPIQSPLGGLAINLATRRQ